MNKEELSEQLKYSSSEYLYIVTWNNLLKQLICPFMVLVKLDIGTLKKGKKVDVEELKVTIELKIVYLIKEQFFYYYHFDILIE